MKLPWIPAEANTVQDLVYYLSTYPEASFDPSTGKPSPPKTSPEDVERPPPPLHALIIAVNEYQDPTMGNLNAPTHDAEFLKQFLKEQLHVPEQNIQTLMNEQATRSNIENAIRQLGDNPAIQKGDPILISYAGHGSQAKAPPGWPSGVEGGFIQMLNPHDFVKAGTDDPDHGQGVLDIVLSKLLSELASKKGNNITVIFDSCHSASGTRGDDGTDDTPRGVKLPLNYTIPLSVLDKYQNIGGEQTRATSVAEAATGLSSHVLLAGCMQDEQSWEMNGRPPRGRFSKSLLDFLSKPGMVETLTYRDLIQCIPDVDRINRQHPQCEGINQSRVLFNGRVPSPRRQVYPVKFDGQQFVLEAGEIHGVTRGTQFAVYADDKLTDQRGMLEAVSTKAINSTLDILPGTPTFTLRTGFALLTRPGNLEDIAVHIALDDELLPIWRKVVQEIQKPSDPSKRSVRLVDSRDQAELALSLNAQGMVEFALVDPRTESLGLTQMPYQEPINADRIWRIISGAADFCFHLRRANPEGTLASKVKLECYELAPSGEFDDEFRELEMPKGNNLNNNGLISVTVGEEHRHGFKLSSSHDAPLYPSVFYFDVSDLSIKPYYLPGTAKRGRVEPPLRANGYLTIGYGSGGWNPLTYSLRPGQKFDIGLLKVFLTTNWVDLSYIEQKSPFESTRDVGEPSKRNEPTWDTITATIMQRHGLS